MFILTKIADLVQIAPEDFGKQSIAAIEDCINEKYSNRVVQKVGLFISLWDVQWTSEGLIGHGTGLVNVNAEFRMVVFRPHLGEVLIARIAKQTAEGIYLSMEFFEDIFVAHSDLPNEAEFVPSENVWIWKDEEQTMYYDNNEMVRFEVMGEEWHDQTPTGPVEQGNVPTSQLPPYKIRGSMKGPGLGCDIWWAE